MAAKKTVKKRDRNRDPITGEPGSHPVGVGLGTAVGGVAGGAALGAAASTAVAGAALGAAAGPVGAVLGVVAGGIVGALAGKSVAETVDPTGEDAYWRENYSSRPYAEKKAGYEAFRPAYQYGWASRARYPSQRFEEVEGELESGWKKTKSGLGWDKARHAVRDAWERIDQRATPGTAPPAGPDTSTEGGQTVRLHEEELRTRKRPVKKGEVRVRKEVVTEHKTLEVPVSHEEVVIERRPLSGRENSPSAFREEEVRVPVRAEQVRVEKTPVVTEEVQVGKRKVQGTKQVSGTVRKERVRVEKTGDATVYDTRKPAKK